VGNESIKDDDLFEDDIYRARYNRYNLNLKLIREFWKKSHFSFDGEFQYSEPDFDAGSVLDTISSNKRINGTNSLTLGLAGASLDLDFRDNVNLPERGLRFYSTYRHGFVDEDSVGSGAYDQIEAFLEYFTTAGIRKPLTLGLRFGGGESSGDVPYYNLLYLGQRDNLRGFVKNRFAGSGRMYLNTELRWQIVAFNRAFIPFRFGVLGFFDTGRIFDNNDLGNKWQRGYGGGIYFVPFREKFTLGLTVASSEEESALLLLNIGSIFQ